MAGKDWFFTVMADDTAAYGPITKENLEFTRVVFDFSCWLDNEGIGAVSYPQIKAEPLAPVPTWQNDYPLDATSVTDVPEDLYPLTVIAEAVTGLSSKLEIRLGGGTPGVVYVVSALVRGATTMRRKQVDVLVSVQVPLNESMVGEVDIAPDEITPPLVVGGTATIPVNFSGRVYVENGTGLPITITLPAAPFVLQRIEPVDILGTFGTAPCTYVGAPANLIDGQTAFVTDIPHDDLIFEWTGSQWIVLIHRYGMLG